MTYTLSWLFYFDYHTKKRLSHIQFSSYAVKRFSLKQQILDADDDTLRQLVHRYDYRKIEYFAEELLETFDTTIRFLVPNSKKMVRLKAVCKSHKDGFSCLMYDEYDLFKLQQKMNVQQIYPLLTNIKNPDDQTCSLCDQNEYMEYMRLLAAVMTREFEN